MVIVISSFSINTIKTLLIIEAKSRAPLGQKNHTNVQLMSFALLFYGY